MKQVLLKKYSNVAIYALIKEGKVETYSVEGNIVTFTDILDAVEYFNHLKELNKISLFNDSEQVSGVTLAKNTADEDDIVFIDIE